MHRIKNISQDSTKEKIENMSRPITSTEIEYVI